MSTIQIEEARQDLMSLRLSSEELAEYHLPPCPQGEDLAAYQRCLAETREQIDEFTQRAGEYKQQAEDLIQALERPTTELLNQALELRDQWRQDLYSAQEQVRQTLAPYWQAGPGQLLEQLLSQDERSRDRELWRAWLLAYAQDLQMGDRWVVAFSHGTVVELVDGEYAGGFSLPELTDAAMELLRRDNRVVAVYDQNSWPERGLCAYYTSNAPEDRVSQFLLLRDATFSGLEQADITLEQAADFYSLEDKRQPQPLFIIDPWERVTHF